MAKGICNGEGKSQWREEFAMAKGICNGEWNLQWREEFAIAKGVYNGEKRKQGGEKGTVVAKNGRGKVSLLMPFEETGGEAC